MRFQRERDKLHITWTKPFRMPRRLRKLVIGLLLKICLFLSLSEEAGSWKAHKTHGTWQTLVHIVIPTFSRTQILITMQFVTGFALKLDSSVALRKETWQLILETETFPSIKAVQNRCKSMSCAEIGGGVDKIKNSLCPGWITDWLIVYIGLFHRVHQTLS